jgi:hypothetical protein
MDKLQSSGAEAALSPRVKSILVVIRERPGIQSGELAQTAWHSHSNSKTDFD